MFLLENAILQQFSEPNNQLVVQNYILGYIGTLFDRLLSNQC